MSFVTRIDMLEAKAAPAPWAAGYDPCHFDAPEVRSVKWAAYMPGLIEEAQLVAELRNAWPAIRNVLMAAQMVGFTDRTSPEGPTPRASRLSAALEALEKLRAVEPT